MVPCCPNLQTSVCLWVRVSTSSAASAEQPRSLRVAACHAGVLMYAPCKPSCVAPQSHSCNTHFNQTCAGPKRPPQYACPPPVLVGLPDSVQALGRPGFCCPWWRSLILRTGYSWHILQRCILSSAPHCRAILPAVWTTVSRFIFRFILQVHTVSLGSLWCFQAANTFRKDTAHAAVLLRLRILSFASRDVLSMANNPTHGALPAR